MVFGVFKVCLEGVYNYFQFSFSNSKRKK